MYRTYRMEAEDTRVVVRFRSTLAHVMTCRWKLPQPRLLGNLYGQANGSSQPELNQ